MVDGSDRQTRHDALTPRGVDDNVTVHEMPGFACVEAVQPTVDDLAAFAEEFDLHELAVEDAVKAHQRPKLERYGDDILITLKTIDYDDVAEEVNIGEVLLLAGDDHLLIVRHGPAHPLDLETPRGPRLDGREGPGVVVHRIIDQIVDGYAPVIAGLEKDVREVEQEVFSPEEVHPTERIYRLRRQFLDFLHSTRGLLKPLADLTRVDQPLSDSEMNEYYRDVEDHLHRAVGRAENAGELVSEILDANLTQVSLRQNADMRKVSAWGAIFLLPTLLAGIWGMNRQHMPVLDWRLGYPLALGVMVLATLALSWRLRRSGWL
jgi:magnesium transporter